MAAQANQQQAVSTATTGPATPSQAIPAQGLNRFHLTTLLMLTSTLKRNLVGGE